MLEDLPRLGPRSRAACRLCKADLERHDGRSITAALACSLGALFLLLPGNLLPLVHLQIFGMHTSNTIVGGIGTLWDHGWVLLAGLSAIFALIFPALRFALLSTALGAVRGGFRPSWLGSTFRWAVRLDTWAMPDVFLLGAFIGYYRLLHVGALHVSIALGGMCFIAAAFLAMLSRAVIDRRAVWRAIAPEEDIARGQRSLSCTSCDLVLPASEEGERCPRCRARLRTRSPDALVRTTAYLVAAFVLFFPSNIFPMNISVEMGQHTSYTIFDGVRRLFESGLWPLAALIFCTSIFIPFAKIAVTGWCVWSVRMRSTRHLVAKTKLFRFAAELGRWSETDPFVIVFYVPLLNFGTLASADAAWGATAFMVMTVLTMLASDAFDPRLMWDAADRRPI